MLFYKARGLERAISARSPSSSSILCLRFASAVFADLPPLGMSVQPDIPISVSALPPSSVKARRLFAHAGGQTSASSFRMSKRGCRVATTVRTGTQSGTSVQPATPSRLWAL